MSGAAHESGERKRRQARAGFLLAIFGSLVLTGALLTGVGYASSSVSDAVTRAGKIARLTKPTVRDVRAAPSAAQSEYGSFVPPNPSSRGPSQQPSGIPAPSGATPLSGPSNAGGVAGSSKSQHAKQGTQGKSKPVGAGSNAGTSQTGGGLPFTGMALWIPFTLGLALIALGATLRGLARRPDPA